MFQGENSSKEEEEEEEEKDDAGGVLYGCEYILASVCNSYGLDSQNTT